MSFPTPRTDLPWLLGHPQDMLVFLDKMSISDFRASGLKIQSMLALTYRSILPLTSRAWRWENTRSIGATRATRASGPRPLHELKNFGWASVAPGRSHESKLRSNTDHAALWLGAVFVHRHNGMSIPEIQASS